MQRLRQAHIEGRLDPYQDCIHCHVPKPRLPVILGSFVINGFAVRKLIPALEKLALFLKIPIFQSRAADPVNTKSKSSNP